jgi:ribosomal protein S18 acetylase RimI-like enzyme
MGADDSRSVEVRNLRDDERAWLAQRLRASWGSELVVSRGVLHDASADAGFVAEVDGERAGFVLYRHDELTVLDTWVRRAGVGVALLRAAADRLRAAGHHRMWLITTNDNTTALRFYQRHGLRLVALYPGAMDEARRTLKPQLPETGNDGIPIRDELELELEL